MLVLEIVVNDLNLSRDRNIQSVKEHDTNQLVYVKAETKCVHTDSTWGLIVTEYCWLIVPLFLV